MVVKEPQMLHRKMIMEVDNPKFGRMKIPGIPIIVYSQSENEQESRPPLLGEHNKEIFSGMLGYSEEELGRLPGKGVI